MKKTRSKSCYHSNSILIKDEEKFRICIPYEEYVSSLNLAKFNLPTDFSLGVRFQPKPITGKARENVKGRYIRVIPEEKTVIRKHVHYKKKNGTTVDFDRNYNVWKKILEINPNFEFEFWENEEGKKFVVSDELIFSSDESIDKSNTFYLNLFLQIFGSFEVLDDSGNFPLPMEKRLEIQILPPGTRTFEELEKVEEFADSYFGKGTPSNVSFRERIDFINKFKPEIIAYGTEGFSGYVVFAFPDKDFVLVESIKSGHATYIFAKSNYMDLIGLDKQSIIGNKLMKQRIKHDLGHDHTAWKKKIWRILK